MRHLSLALLAQAQRVAPATQGFADPRTARPTIWALMRTAERIGVLQIATANVLQCSTTCPTGSGPTTRD